MLHRNMPAEAGQPAVPPAGSGEKRAASPHRADLQGLRAVAVLVVLLYHTGLGPSGGFIGVDIFFVLSGFLITGLLVREHDRTGRISLTSFWARRARRLLPASVLVMLVTCVAARFYLPASRWESIGQDAVSAAAYVLNWRLAGESVDYLSEGAAPSPLQHFWSLAIEEQFYVIWPLLISLVLLARTRKVAIAVVGAVIGISLVLALVTYDAQTYFTTHTRVWELAAGAMCAVIVPVGASRPHLPRLSRFGAALSWAGLAMLGVALFVVKPETMWPGPLTVLVVVGTVLMLLFGESERGVRTVLSNQVMTRFGDISYSLYLWHWPLVVFAERDGELTWWAGVLIVLASIVLATLTYVLVEGPGRTARFWAPSRLGIAGGLALALVAGGAGTALSHSKSVGDPDVIVGAAAKNLLQKSASVLAPRPEQAKLDNGEIYERGCPGNYITDVPKPCVFDYRTSPDGPRVFAVGDSKVGQWMPALQVLAKQHGWELTSITKAGCAFSTTHRLDGPEEYTSCITWNETVTQQVLEQHPDLLVTTQLERYTTLVDGKALKGPANRQEMIRGLAERLTQLKSAGIPAVVVSETPRMFMQVPDCVSMHLEDLLSCSQPQDKALNGARIVGPAAKESGVPIINLNGYLCARGTCPAVIGDVLVYRDDHHLTATYSKTLAPYVEERLERALPTAERDLLFLS